MFRRWMFIRSFPARLNQANKANIGCISCARSICPYKCQPESGEIFRGKSWRKRMKLRSGVLAGLLLLGLAGPQAHAADDYPARQIKIIVPFPAGAGPDQVARLLGQRLQEELGQTIVIENRSGALGSLGAQEVA